MTDTSNTIKHIASPLARQTLQDGALTRPVASVRPIRLLPWLQVVKIGGKPAESVLTGESLLLHGVVDERWAYVRTVTRCQVYDLKDPHPTWPIGWCELPPEASFAGISDGVCGYLPKMKIVYLVGDHPSTWYYRINDIRTDWTP